jgi:hypothetical protein
MKRDKAKLSPVPEHKMRLARWRLWCLTNLWALDRAMADKPRGERFQRVLAEIKKRYPSASVSNSTLQRWEKQYRVDGLSGLVDGRRGTSCAARLFGLQHRRQLASWPLPDLLDRAAELLGVISERMRMEANRK